MQSTASYKAPCFDVAMPFSAARKAPPLRRSCLNPEQNACGSRLSEKGDPICRRHIACSYPANRHFCCALFPVLFGIHYILRQAEIIRDDLFIYRFRFDGYNYEFGEIRLFGQPCQ